MEDLMTRYVGVIAEQLIEIKEELQEVTHAIIDIRETMEVDEDIPLYEEHKELIQILKKLVRSIERLCTKDFLSE